MKSFSTNRSLLVVFVCLSLTRPLLSQSPVVHKIEPPNWWIRYTPELTLLLTGENLNSAQATSMTAGITVDSLNASANGHYLFVHLLLSSDLQPGKASIELSSSKFSTTVELPLLQRNDPRGHYQGISRDDVIYLIMPDRFADGDLTNNKPAGSDGSYDRLQPRAYHGGDIRGVRDHLQYLHELGVTTVWLTPVWKNADSDYHGYHVVDFYAIDDHMGTLPDYQALVADAHKLGMKVLIDYVVNHTGPKHPWVEDPPTPTWFHGTLSHHLEPSYSFNGIVDPHASPREYLNTLEGWFVDRLPDLNPDDPALALYLLQNSLWWTETAQLDGFRLDTFPYSSRKFWSWWHERLHRVYPDINDIGEVADSDPAITSFFQGGRKQFDGIDSGLTTVFDFPMERVLRDVLLNGAPMGKLVDVLRHDELYPQADLLVPFFGNHDHTRFMNEKGATLQKLKAAFSLLLTLRGIPQVYSGDEIAMPGGEDPDNRRDFPGGFPADVNNAFTSLGQTLEQKEIFAHVHELLMLRKNHPALREGKQWHIGWDDNYYAFVRELPEEQLLVVYNNSSNGRNIDISIQDTPVQGVRSMQTIFGNATSAISDTKLHVSLSGQSLAVFSLH